MEDVLKFAIESGMIDLSYIQDKYEMNKREELLSKHKWAISQGKDGYWRTYLLDEEGKRKMVKKKTRKDVENAVIDYYKTSEKYTFKSVYEEWKDLQRKYGVCGNTIQKYNSDYIRFFKNSKLENMEISKITEEDITEFMVMKVKTMALKEKAGKALWGYLNGVFKYARVHKLIADNPCIYVNTKLFSRFYDRSKKSSKERTLNNQELNLLLQQLRKSHIEKPEYIQSYAVEFAIYTGMRVGEIAALKWSDVNDDTQVILINKSEKFDRSSKEFYISSTKNGEEREFPISDEIQKVLNAVKKVELKNGYIGEFVFQDSTGRIHARSISHCMRYKCKQAEIDIKGIHALRRTLNSKMRCNGVSGVVAASLLGHTEEVNEKNYTYDVSEMKYKKEIISKLSKIS